MIGYPEFTSFKSKKITHTVLWTALLSDGFWGVNI